MPSIINTTYPQYGIGGDFADATYKATLAGYQQRQAQYQGGVANNIAGYERLYNHQQDWGNEQAIAAKQLYQQQGDDLQQKLASRGLSNSSVYGAGSQGIGANYINTLANISGQRLQNQNQIAGNELQYQGQATQGLAGLQGEQLGWQGNVQQNTQAQNFQGATQQEQFRQQQALNQQQFGYNQQAAQQGFGHQYALAQQSLGNQQSLQREFGFFARGGSVPPAMGSDIVPARLTPGEFVLSNDMIAALQDGRLNNTGLMNMIRQQRMQVGQPPVVPSGALHTTSTLYNDQPIDQRYQPTTGFARGGLVKPMMGKTYCG